MIAGELLLDVMRLSLTTAALTIPAISVAYLIISRTEGETERMSKVIGYGSISAIVLVFCSLITFVILCFGYEDQMAAQLVSGGMFVFGCSLLLYILIVLAGFKREIPLPKTKTQEETQKQPALTEHPTS